MTGPFQPDPETLVWMIDLRADAAVSRFRVAIAQEIPFDQFLKTEEQRPAAMKAQLDALRSELTARDSVTGEESDA